MTGPGGDRGPGERRGKVVVVSGPSGVGKSTVVQQALARTGAHYSVSATTRSPRPGEVDGGSYHFVGREDFQRRIDAGSLLEWAEVFGHYYGTPEEPVREALGAGRTVVLEIDVQGGLQVARKLPEATFVLIVPPSPDELARRLAGRGTEPPEVLQRRLAKANEELRIARDSGVYTVEVVNDRLSDAVERLVEILQQEQSE